MRDRAAIFYYVARLQDGEATPIDLTDRVKSFQFVDREGGLDRLTLTVDNKDLRNFDEPLFEYGGKLRVSWGNGRSTAPVRDMVIRKVTGARELSVQAVGKDGAALDTIKKRRRFEGVTRSEVVEQIARENGFVQPDIEVTTERFESIAQSNLTDGQLLRKLADLQGFEFYVDAFGLHWHRRRVDQAPVRRYVYFIDSSGGDIIDFNVENDVTRKPGKVTVKSRDPITKEEVEASASNSTDTDRVVMSEYVGIIDGEDGELRQVPEVAHEATVPSNAQTQEDAEAEAKAKFRKTAQTAVKLSLQLVGDPSLTAKTVIEVSGIGKRLSGKYYIREVTHALDATSGYSMSVKAITDGFQAGRGAGKGGGNDAASGQLSALAEQLRQAATLDLVTGVDGETGQLTNPDFAKSTAVTNAAISLAAVLDKLGTLTGIEQAKQAIGIAKSAMALASNASKIGAGNIAAAARASAVACQQIAQAQLDVVAKGQKNTKTLNDSEVRAVKTVDSQGNEVTVYQNTGGKEK